MDIYSENYFKVNASSPTSQIIDHKGQVEVCIEISLDESSSEFEFTGQVNYQVNLSKIK